MDIKAQQKFLITSPRKLREIVGLVKDMPPVEAFEKLPYVKKRAAEPLKKVIGTAIANAKQLGANETDLVFKEIQINQGPRLKRWRAGARGRAKPYKKRMSHIRVVLTTREPKNQKSAEQKNKEAVGRSNKASETLSKLKKPLSSLKRKTAGQRKKKGGNKKVQKVHKSTKK
jgi:large subunit ribosomal protein L22